MGSLRKNQPLDLDQAAYYLNGKGSFEGQSLNSELGKLTDP